MSTECNAVTLECMHACNLPWLRADAVLTLWRSFPIHAQWTMFLFDPSGNALEFKAMTNPANLFAKYYVS